MLKAGIKRRRTQRQITDEKAEEAIRQQAIDKKLAKFDELQQKYQQVQQEAEGGKNAAIILNNMLQKGEIEMDQNGNVRVISQQVEQSENSHHSQQVEMQENIESSSQFQI